MKSIPSSKQVERNNLQVMVQELRECLLGGDVVSHAGLPTENMWANISTKKMYLPEGFGTMVVS